MADHEIALGQFEAEATRLTDDGKTSMFVAVGGKIACMVAVADTVNPESAATARQVGIDRALADVALQDKAHEVRKLQLAGMIVGMVGDGANDALTQADVGFAIGTATDLAIEAVDITLMSGSLSGDVTDIAVSKATMRNVFQNLIGAFLYITLGIPSGWTYCIH